MDRIDSNVFQVIAYTLSGQDNALKGADDLWISFQDKINGLMNNNSRKSNIKIPIKNRPDWDDVKDVLNGNKPISDLEM